MSNVYICIYFRFVIGDENVIHSKLSAQIENRKFAYIQHPKYRIPYAAFYNGRFFFFDVEKLSEIQDFFFQI